MWAMKSVQKENRAAKGEEKRTQPNKEKQKKIKKEKRILKKSNTNEKFKIENKC